MTDIQTRADIDLLMQAFYKKAMVDDVIGFYFTEVTQLNLTTHLPVIIDFWETILLDGNNYHGDPMKTHQHIHTLSAFKEEHFNRWVQLFKETVNQLFEGDIAERAKQRAESISTVMKIKVIYQGIQKK